MIVNHLLTLPDAILIFFAAMIGGAINSVAGGGSFISFPALLFTGVESITANATNTVALWPGSMASAGAYRNELDAQKHVLLSMGFSSLLGGIIGAQLLLSTRPATFERLLPYLLLTATLLFTFGGAFTSKFKSRVGEVKAPGWVGQVGVCLLQFVIAVYGGFFGGGIGILMLATLSLMGMTHIHTMNALKTVLGSLINGVAVVMFVIAGKVIWPQAVVMIAGAIIGGYFGAHYAKKMEPAKIRLFVILIGFSMTAWFFYRYR